MILNDKKYVWAPDGREGFLLGTVTDIKSESISVSIHGSKNKVVSAPYKRVFPAEDNINKDHDDNCELMYLNEATLLHNLRLRYKNDKIYTYVANILIAVNPYNEISHLYTKETIMRYKGKSLGVLPPHVFAIADKTYRDMKVTKQSQSIIVSGESGAGKTESTKYIIRYLTESYGQGISGDIEKRIVETNPLLEAFGNAKTLRNLNSSRFGKYVEVHFGDRSKILGAFVSHYLLEKTRICNQSPGERNYHVFYRMCAGAPQEMKAALKLKDASKFHYLNKSSLKEAGINDVKGFKLLDDAMNYVGITMEQKADIYRVAAVVLHLGNIEFQENSKNNKGGCQIAPSSESVMSDVAKLMGVQPGEVHMCLTTRIMVTTKGGAVGTLYKVPLRPDQAAAGRDAFAKSIYSKLFDYIVSCVNQCFPFKLSDTYIGVLDIAGFEFFEVNGFEQFCINYCNEKLQQFFNERILKDEQALYKKEGLGLKDIAYADNEDCIELFEKKRNGIMDLLDEEMKFPTPSELHFTLEVHQRNKDHFRLAVPRKSPLSIHRAVKDDEGFLIRHFAGAVCYQTAGFLTRNNDALHENLEVLLQESSDPFIQNLFPPPPKSSNSKGNMNTKKLMFESIGKKFRTQLKLLMEKLRNTGSNFIRCIKPNDQMKNHSFEGGQILSQLQCAGMVSVLHLMQEGFPSRTPFASLYNKYKSFLPANLVRLDPRMFCKALFHAVGMDNDDFAFGLTKVFFRPGKFAAFDQLMQSDPETLNRLIKKVLKWIIRNRWKRAIWCAVSVQKLANKIKFRREMHIRIQKTVRMFLAVQKHRPRYQGLVKLRKLEEQIVELTKLVASLKKDKKSYQGKVSEIKHLTDQAIKKIKGTILKQNEMNLVYTGLVQKVNALLKQLHSEKAVQKEQERLEKIQVQMIAEKKRQEHEEQKNKKQEEERRERIAQEARMKEEAKEAEQNRKFEEENSKVLIEKITEEQKNIEFITSQHESQKQRDYELALRLAADPTTMVSEDRIQLKRNIPNGGGGSDNKFDHLRKWTYAELRDTINTSCDLELLEGCRIEFHRRLKVYHAWRKRHMKNKNNSNQRAPVDVIRSSEAISAPTSLSLTNPFRKDPVNTQRYFSVPFAKPSDQYRYEEYSKSGWWYAHFDGEWVARQIEIHPNGALLLVAGHNDMEICELSLSETKLAARTGAEITADDFNDMWKKYGGDVDKIFKSKSRNTP